MVEVVGRGEASQQKPKGSSRGFFIGSFHPSQKLFSSKLINLTVFARDIFAAKAYGRVPAVIENLDFIKFCQIMESSGKVEWDPFKLAGSVCCLICLLFHPN